MGRKGEGGGGGLERVGGEGESGGGTEKEGWKAAQTLHPPPPPYHLPFSL